MREIVNKSSELLESFFGDISESLFWNNQNYASEVIFSRLSTFLGFDK